LGLCTFIAAEEIEVRRVDFNHSKLFSQIFVVCTVCNGISDISNNMDDGEDEC